MQLGEVRIDKIAFSSIIDVKKRFLRFLFFYKRTSFLTFFLFFKVFYFPLANFFILFNLLNSEIKRL